MDLEDELRRAMAEHVADASAAHSLAGDVRRRYRRRVARIRATIGVAAAAVVAVAIIPGYQSFRADPVSAPGGTPAGRHGDGQGRGPGGGPVESGAPGGAGSPSPRGGTAPESPRPLVARPSEPGPGGGAGRPGVGVPVPRWMTSLPAGLSAAGPCGEKDKDGRRTTNCRWAGTKGWIEVHITRGTGLTAPGDLVGGAPVTGGAPVAGKVKVHGRPAVVTDRPDRGRQITWVERAGVGVLVLVGPTLRDQLLPVAEGVRP